MNRSRIGACVFAVGFALALSACGGGNDAAVVGGSITGLAAGTSVTLQENKVTALSVSGSAAFEFPATLPADSAYTVTIAAQPAGATCSVVNGSGTIDDNADSVQNVAVVCQPGTTLGGTVTGLPANTTLTLSDGISSLPVAANGAFAFADLFANGAGYAVSVSAQPSGELCTVMNGSGAIDAIGDAVTTIAVNCAPAPSLGGTVAGLAANATFALSDGSTTLAVTANGAFGFSDSFAPGAGYSVSVAAQPAGQTCTVANGAGIVDAAGDGVTNVTVSCTTNGTVGGSVQGLAANGAVTLGDGVSTVAVSANGSFAFADLFSAGQGYAVTVTGQPANQTCTVVNGSGTLDANDDGIANIGVSCI
jgi:hypothetical protein